MAKIGLIGCGLWGRNILKTLLALEQEVLVVEAHSQRRTEIDTEFSIKSFEKIADLPTVDGFIVATPASTHEELVFELLPFGCPLFVEKPLTIDSMSARKIADAGGNLIFVMHIWQYHAGVQALAKIATDGELGAVNVIRTTRKNWTSPRLDVDSVWTMVPHDLSITKAIIGHIPPPHFAQSELMDGRAVGMLAVLGAEPPQVIIDTSNRYEDKRREIRLHCEKGVACLPKDDSGFILISRESETGQQSNRPTKRNFEHRPPLCAELESFIRYLQGGPPPPTDINTGIEVVETVATLRQLAGLSK